MSHAPYPECDSASEVDVRVKIELASIEVGQGARPHTCARLRQPNALVTDTCGLGEMREEEREEGGRVRGREGGREGGKEEKKKRAGAKK